MGGWGALLWLLLGLLVASVALRLFLALLETAYVGCAVWLLAGVAVLRGLRRAVAGVLLLLLAVALLVSVALLLISLLLVALLRVALLLVALLLAVLLLRVAALLSAVALVVAALLGVLVVLVVGVRHGEEMWSC